MKMRRRKERGGALMEGAMIFIPLFAMMMAIVDFSFAIFLRSTFQHAVREGVRYAVTYQTQGGMGHDASIREVVRRQSMGFLNGRENLIHIEYCDPATLACNVSNDPGNIVEVSIENYRFGWFASLLRDANPLSITVRASDRMEGLPGGVSPPAR